MDQKNQCDVLIQLDVHQTSKIKINKECNKTYQGHMKMHEFLKYICIQNKINDQIQAILSNSFLANPFDTLYDLANCFGRKENDLLKLNVKISQKIAYG